MITDAGRVPIGRRAWIGAGRHGASLAPDGTIDWYAAGGLTAPPDLRRLLDGAGPALRVGPVREGSGAGRHLPATEMHYRPGTGIVETRSDGGAGRQLQVVDFVPAGGEGGVVRLVRALAGPVDVEVEVMVARSSRDAAPSGTGLVMDRLAVHAPGLFESAPLDRDTPRWRAVIRLDTGEEMAVSAGRETPVGTDQARRMLSDAEAAWRGWLGPVVVGGPYRAAVERALVSVKALTGPSGAPAAAGTTSLPRRVGSERSSDDRWIRVRDVARAVDVLARAGLAEDAEAAEAWLRRAVTEADRPVPTWLDPDGQPVPEPEELPYEGWRRSQPVSSGRAPLIDVGLIGAITAAVGASMRGPGGRADDPGPLSAAFDAVAEATDWAADHWSAPDAGRWEIERPPRLYVAGRISVCTALDRMARLARAANPLDLRAVAWQQERRGILSWLEADAVAADGGLRMDPGSEQADAALLAALPDGPWPAAHPVVVATVERVLDRLSSDRLLYRYSDQVADERSGPDLPDLQASLEAVRALAGARRWEEAHDRMERVVGLLEGAGPGLLAETADPLSGELYGNFPSTAAALALVDAALALEAGPR
ncbi:MAG TPA: glycoside hydrolase family 15 protein [Acidimicrobiales bacterium]|nr:glycoside hydrolase family 15 protein [Acidimicrobiales bacterium]